MTDEDSREMLTADFVIITALEEERDAVLGKLPGYKRVMPSSDDIRVYYKADLSATFPDGSTDSYRIVVMPLVGMGRVQGATATNDAVHRWNPRYVLMVGIAGGVADKGIKLGDVIVPDQIVDYELQKLTSKGLDIRWQVYPTDQRFIGVVFNFLDQGWQKLIAVQRPEPGEPRRHVGPIASGDKVIAFGKALAKYRETWSRLIGVEMEAGGVAISALQAASQPKFFMIRGVSDLADQNKGSAEVERWRLYACDVAAAYTIGLLQSGPILLKPKAVEQIQSPNEEDRDELQNEKKHLTEALAELRLNLRITQKNIRKFGVGHVPLHLTRQEMALQEQIRETEKQIKEIYSK